MQNNHYDWEDRIGRKIGLEGTGIVGIMVGDHLHPPMIASEEIWRDGTNWKRGAELCTIRLAEMASLQEGQFVLDVGCGVGGSSRLLAKNYRTNVVGINTSKKQIKTANRITAENNLDGLVKFIEANAAMLPFQSSSFNILWTFNMFYHVRNKKRAFEEFSRVLHTKGKLAFDDWVVTNDIDDGEHSLLKHDWNSEDWTKEDKLYGLMKRYGFKIERIEDYSKVSLLMDKYFSRVFESQFRKEIESLDAEWGHMMADHFKQAVERTIDFYQEGKIKYIQLVAIKK